MIGLLDFWPPANTFSFSFPSLLTIDGNFKLFSYYHLGFSFAPLESVSVLWLNSNLTRYVEGYKLATIFVVIY